MSTTDGSIGLVRVLIPFGYMITSSDGSGRVQMRIHIFTRQTLAVGYTMTRPLSRHEGFIATVQKLGKRSAGDNRRRIEGDNPQPASVGQAKVEGLFLLASEEPAKTAGFFAVVLFCLILALGCRTGLYRGCFFGGNPHMDMSLFNGQYVIAV